METADGLWLRPSPPHVPNMGTAEVRKMARAETADTRYAQALAADKGLIPVKVPTSRRNSTGTPRTATTSSITASSITASTGRKSVPLDAKRD